MPADSPALSNGSAPSQSHVVSGAQAPSAPLRYDCQVCIVGAGIVGMVTALLLKRLGINVLIFERQTSVYPLPRAVSLSGDAIRICIDAGLGEELLRFVAGATDTESVAWKDALGDTLVDFSLAAPTQSGYSTGNIFCQPIFETATTLACEANEVPIHRGWNFYHYTTLPSGRIAADLESYKGRNRYNTHVQVACDYLISAEGANSTIRELAGISREDYGFDYDWLILDTRPVNMQAWPWAQICDPARPTTMTGGGQGRRRWEFMRLPHESIEELTDPSKVWSLLKPYGLTSENCEIERAVVYTFRCLNATSYINDKICLIGDSAHQTPPFLNQGLNCGLRDGGQLAWRLASILKKKATPALLHSYTAERRQQMDAILQKVIKLGLPICETDEEKSKAMRDELKQMTDDGPVYEDPLGEGAFVDFARGGGTQQLVRGSQFSPLEPYCLAPVEDYTWRLLVAPESEDEALANSTASMNLTNMTPKLSGVATKILSGLKARVVEVPSYDADEYEQWFASHKAAKYALVRPDHYVYGFASSPLELEEMLQQVHKRLGTA